jgi:three-Cys-motif partner protein
MAAPKTTLWKREPHTEGKHLVLENYLKAWFPILGMGNRNRRILFIDGFAGPGEYRGGEEGSPVVAMRVLAEHPAEIKAEVVFFFMEREIDRARHLERLVAQWRPKLPASAKVHVREGRFDASMTDVLDELDEHGRSMAPALVMIDPFGVKGMPMEVVRRIMANRKCEVYLSFMSEAMNRFVTEAEFETPMDGLFGSGEWRQARDLAGRERRSFLHELYRKQLKDAGATQVVRFHLFAGNRLKYSIFFGTRHSLGSDRMKQAIWTVAPFGDYRFRGGEQAQISFLEPDFEPLQEALRERFEAAGWVSIEDIEEFVRSDATIYHTGQLRSEALRPMEESGRIDVDPKTRKKRFNYPEGCRINFRPQALSLF